MDSYLFILQSERMPDALTAEALYELMKIESGAIIATHEHGEIPVEADLLEKARLVLKLATARLLRLQANCDALGSWNALPPLRLAAD